MMHIDVERLTSSTIGAFVLEHADELELDLDEVEGDLGIDPAKDLFSVTIYGDGHPEDDSRVVLEMSAVVDKVLEELQEDESYRREEVSGHVLHRWADGEPTFAHIIATADPNRRLVVLGGSASDVVGAAEVIEGGRPSLRQALDRDAAAAALPAPGSIAFAYARGLPWVGDGEDPASAIARLSDRVRLELREADEVTSFDMLISAGSADDASNIVDVMRGVLALGQLLGDQEPEMRDLSRHIKVTGEGNDVHVTLQAASKELLECLGAVVDED
jgi:hypothetical protein